MTWIPRNAGTSEDLLAVSAVTAAEGSSGCAWVSGRSGTVLRTTDGGKSWESLDPGTGRDLLDIAAVDRDSAWAVAEGSRVLRTTDGGRNWEHLETGDSNSPRCLVALDRETAVVAGDNGAILLTLDGGVTWHRQESGTADHLVALALVPEEDGGTLYALGDAGMLTKARFSFLADGKSGEEAGEPGGEGGELLRDAYLSWSAAATGVESAPRALCAVEGGVLWMGGRGFLRRSSDRGEHWEAVDTGVTGEVNAIFACGAENLWAVGEEGLAMRSYDGGKTWARQYIPRGRTLRDVWAVDANTAWAAGEGGTALLTTDGGFTWSAAYPGTAEDLYAVSAADARNLWVAGGKGTVLRSWNGGKSWEEQPSRTAYDLLDLCAVDGKTAWAVGRRGVVLRTFDEGYTWYRLDQGEGPELTGIWAQSAFDAWAVGRDGTVLHIREGGQALDRVETGSRSDLRAIAGASSEGRVVLLAVGDEGTLLRSEDGGSSWEALDTGFGSGDGESPPDILGVSMSDARHAWICGEGGLLARTADGGLTWEKVETGSVEDLHGVASPEAGTVWSVGWKGTILHRRSSPRLDMVSPAQVEAEGTVTLVGMAFGGGGPGHAVTFGGVRVAGCSLWSDRLIKVAVPMEASVREEVRVITPRGTSAPREVAIFPKLKGVSPRYCHPGDRITLSGASFGRERGDSYVTVGTVRIREYDYWSNNYVRFRVPGGLPSLAEIRVTTPSGASNTVRIRISPVSPTATVRAGPRLDFLDPPSASPGSEVRILGSRFGSSRGSSYVVFGGIRATEYLSWSDDLVVVRVPPGAAGTVQVRVVVSGVQSNAVTFTVPARPVIRSLNPSSGPAGSRVEIVGEWFGDREGPSHYVSFGGVNPGSYEYWSGGRILVKIPTGISGEVPVTVTTPAGTSEPVTFRVRSPHLLGVSACGNKAFAVGENGTIMVSGDSGRSWVKVESGVSLRLNAVSAADANTAWAVGEGGVILKTADGGATWTRHPVGSTVDLLGISAADANTAWAVGEGGVILKTADGGATWTRQASGTRTTLRAVCAADAATAWAVGEGGVILKTADGGATWTPQNSRLSSGLYAVSAADATTAWAVGEGGVILKTADGGATWTPQDAGILLAWRGVCSSGSQRAWVVGSCGALSTRDGGRTWTVESAAGADYRAVCTAGGGALAVGLYGVATRFAP